MTTTPQLPSELFNARDDVIKNLYADLNPPKNLELIHKWLEEDGWDALIGSITNEAMVVNIPRLAYCFNDIEFILGWLGENQVITDEMRVSHVRMLIQNAIDNGDGYDVPSAYSYLIENNDRTAVIGCTVDVLGQAGTQTNWWGVYKSHTYFLDDLKNTGLIPIEFIADISDAEILAYWKY